MTSMLGSLERLYNSECNVKEWLQNCCRNVSEKVSSVLPDEGGSRFTKNKSTSFANLVITPTTVPDFTIPQSYGRPRPLSKPPSCEDINHTDSFSGASQASSQSSSDSISSAHSPSLVMGSFTSSDPASPNSEISSVSSRKRSRRGHAILYDKIKENPEDTTNADPLSRAAMSLPHLKTKTKFGFETLTECPHTTRKESLFHGGLNIRPVSGVFGKKVYPGQIKISRSDDTLSTVSDIGCEYQKRVNSKRRNVTSMVTPLGVTMSPYDSMDASYSPTSRSPETHTFDPSSTEPSEDSPVPVSDRRRRFTARRPASVNHDDLPSFLTGMQDKSGKARHGSYGDVLLPQEELLQLLRISALTSTCGMIKSYPPVASESSTLQAMVIPKSEYNGELKFKVSYNAEERELEVHILEGINLASSHYRTNPVNAFVKLTLYPWAVQKFTTSIVRRNNDPVFDQVFTFTDVQTEDLKAIRLSMKLFTRERFLKKNELLGEVVLDLSELNFELVTCHELIRDVEAEEVPQELGRLQLQICFHANSKKLDVTLRHMKDLPRQAGGPDTYVTLELRQPGRPDVCLQSKVKRRVTTNDVDEIFTFDISPKIEDLNYTCLTLTVYEREIIISDRVIGDVRLGFGATEESEFEHWNSVLTTPDKDFIMWHMIMEEE